MKPQLTVTLCRWELASCRSLSAAQALAERGWELTAVTTSPAARPTFFLKRPRRSTLAELKAFTKMR